MHLGSSDIHFEPYETHFRVRFRIDGVLSNIEDLPFAQKEELISRIKIMADLDIAEKRRPQDGKIAFNFDGRDIDIRVSILPTQFGEKVVLRLLDREQIKWDISSLGMDDKEAEILRKYIHLPYGMIIVTGPTGSGKTTTLYSALSEINTGETNITTIEDPIEYNLNGINQTHIRDNIGFTFANALRSILRQDPDIIMVGEMRDNETADISIRSALTGHLVFSTLHTNDALSSIIRLLNMGIEPYLIASSVKLVIAQRLVRLNCPLCRTEYIPDPKTLSALGLQDYNKSFIKGTGCEQCRHTGYLGRTGIFELMPVTERLGNLIMERRSSIEIKQQAISDGMTFLFDNAIDKAKKGITTPEEILRKVVFQPDRG
jgi:type II secretory ATPase GspE/PulE/Tfp pilus assembly ATPase PilB-like protein